MTPVGDGSVLSAGKGGSGGGKPFAQPIVFLPFRLETRFGDGQAGPELWLRVYPSQISIDAHDPRLSPDEDEAGRRYWDQVWAAATLADEKPAWRALAAMFGPQRAAFVAQALTPVNFQPHRPGRGRPHPGRPQFPQGLATRDSSFEQPTSAVLLPHHWTAVTYTQGAESHRVDGLPIPGPLAMGPTPHATPVLDPASGLTVDDGMRWLVDFDRALEVGMAMRIPLTADEQTGGFDRIVVFGVPERPSGPPPVSYVPPPSSGGDTFAGLLEAHRFSDGLAFLPQGSPTNNTALARSAYSRGDDGYEESFAVERSGALTLGDAETVAAALGVPAATFEHTAHADLAEQDAARHMGVALWPGTLGYFLTQVMSPVFDPDTVEAARSHFLDWVRPRGPLPAFRVGSTPYGILPVTSVSHWAPPAPTALQTGLHRLMSLLRSTWFQSSHAVPQTGGSSNPGDDLVGILGMDASALEYRLRYGVGPEIVGNWSIMFDLPGGQSQLDALWQATADVLQHYGYGTLRPRLGNFGLAEESARVASPAVCDEPLSETATLADDYLSWLATAPLADLRAEAYPGGTAPDTFLYRVLRHSLVTQAADLVLTLLVANGQVQPNQTFEPELVDVDERSTGTMTPWRALDQPIAGLTMPGATATQYIDSLSDLTGTPFERLAEMRASLAALAKLPTAELERLLSETLDSFSHRIDPWIGSFANERLAAQRAGGQAGSEVGGFAWVEDIRPGAPRNPLSGDELNAVDRLDAAHAAATGGPASRGVVQEPATDNGGFIHAPSLVQAQVGAILRCGYLSHREQPDDSQLAVDLSSGRVDKALWLIDGVRQGQPLGGLLGYRLESALHAAGLDQWIQPLRDAYPLVANKLTQPAAASDAAGAANVVDGLALQRAWAGGTSLPGGVPSEVATALDGLADDVDSLGDVAIAEGVFQVLRGNYGRAGGLLDALSRGDYAPEPEVVRTQPGGIDAVHRIASMVVGDAGGGTGVRASAEPRLDAWAGARLPDPASVRCSASYVDASGATQELVVRLSDLGLDPLDVLALADAPDVAAGSELESRIAWAARGSWNVDPAAIAIDFDRDPATWAATDVSFPEALLVARALRDLIAGARPLRSSDLFEAGIPDDADQEDLSARAATVGAALDSALGALAAASDEHGLRAALLEASALGVLGSIPDTRVATGADTLAALQAQAGSVQAELTKRQAAVAAAADPVAKIEAALGRSFTVLPRFRLSGTHADGSALRGALAQTQALLGSDRDARERWLQQLTHVRPAVSRLDSAATLAQLVAGAAPLDLQLAQLPALARGRDRWLALAPRHGDAPQPSGRLSLAVELSATFDPGAWLCGLMVDEWVERVPAATQTTGLTFHYEEPGSRAPQAVLLAVCPDQRPEWNDDLIVETLNETLSLAKMRTVDLDSLGGTGGLSQHDDLGQILPGLWFAFNPDGQTVSFDQEVIWK